jgi:hypothetical protein
MHRLQPLLLSTLFFIFLRRNPSAQICQEGGGGGCVCVRVCIVCVSVRVCVRARARAG